jgi:hypothetical protein
MTKCAGDIAACGLDHAMDLPALVASFALRSVTKIG